MSQTYHGHISTAAAPNSSYYAGGAINAPNCYGVPEPPCDPCGPSLGLAHDRVDGALNLIRGIRADLCESADRVLGPAMPIAATTGSVPPPTVVGSLPSLLQKLSWLHGALDDLTEQAQRFRAL